MHQSIDSILVPTDGSDGAETGARHGIGLAADVGAELHVLSVVDALELDASLAGVDETDPKGRFERDGAASEPPRGAGEPGDDTRVRAAYGHSVDVTLDPTDAPVPDELHHGTAPRSVDAIERDGLRPMGRQQVHLSASVADAESVGRRHAHAADPVVFVVDSAALLDDYRITKRGHETYTVDRVPPAYLTRR